MPVIRDNVQHVFGIVKDRMAGGLTSAAREASEQYRADVSEVTHTTHPSGPFGPETSPRGRHSQPGEFPDRETGQGEQSIGLTAATPEKLKSQYGVSGAAGGVGPLGDHVTAGGLHLIALMAHGRLGPDATLRIHQAEVKEGFRIGARS